LAERTQAEKANEFNSEKNRLMLRTNAEGILARTNPTGDLARTKPNGPNEAKWKKPMNSTKEANRAVR